MHREYKIERVGSTLVLVIVVATYRYAGTKIEKGLVLLGYYFQARTSVVRTIVRQAWLLRLDTLVILFIGRFFDCLGTKGRAGDRLDRDGNTCNTCSFFYVRSSYFPRLIDAEIL